MVEKDKKPTAIVVGEDFQFFSCSKPQISLTLDCGIANPQCGIIFERPKLCYANTSNEQAQEQAASQSQLALQKPASLSQYSRRTTSPEVVAVYSLMKAMSVFPLYLSLPSPMSQSLFLSKHW